MFSGACPLGKLVTAAGWVKRTTAMLSSRTTRIADMNLMKCEVDLKTFSTRTEETRGSMRRPMTTVENSAATSAEDP